MRLISSAVRCGLLGEVHVTSETSGAAKADAIEMKHETSTFEKNCKYDNDNFNNDRMDKKHYSTTDRSNRRSKKHEDDVTCETREDEDEVAHEWRGKKKSDGGEMGGGGRREGGRGHHNVPLMAVTVGEVADKTTEDTAAAAGGTATKGETDTRRLVLAAGEENTIVCTQSRSVAEQSSNQMRG